MDNQNFDEWIEVKKELLYLPIQKWTNYQTKNGPLLG